REGIRLLERGEEGAREALGRGVRLAPIDPRLYLPLARACREAEIDLRAAEYYSKYLAVFPEQEESGAARRELAELDPELAGVFDPPARPREAPLDTRRASVSLLEPLGAGIGLGLALAALLALLAWSWLRRGVSLFRLLELNPELHPAAAYLIGSLRHELLKHRVGAAADALAAFDTGRASSPQVEFLLSRLYGSQPLDQAWQAYEEAFLRALGPRLDLRRDPLFRRASRAIRRISALERRVSSLDARAIHELTRAHRTLRELDRALAARVAEMVRTRIDRALLEQVCEEVRSEYAAGGVALDELKIEAIEDQEIEVEVFRVDLVLVLKNILRNALLAVARGGGEGAPSPRVGIDVQLELEPTGEETVRLRVLDTSREELRTEMLMDRRVDRGLGLVVAAIARYGGSIQVEAAEPGWAKAVVVSFFRALDDDTLEPMLPDPAQRTLEDGAAATREAS
ncbi:MAG: hypothetical protein OEY14_10450, partial [Myxococcales bacterium]|nr:hypothetical protein [Myxococcales bacterium]